eukprot:Rhum_TRINITY_DN14689_c10_g2::Rhum_TRINITY_DN14689_c10_g2_i1::g.109839::m.109839
MRGGREGKGGRGQRKVFGGGEFGGEKGRGASTPHRDHAACAVLRGRPKHPLACARRLGGALDARRRVRLVLHRSAARTLLVACVDADGGDCVEALASVVPRRAVPPRTSAPQRRRHVAVPLNLLPQPRRLRPLRRRVGHVPRRQQRALGVLPRPLRVEVQRALPRRRQHTLLAEVARQVQPLVPLRLALAVRRRRRAVLRRARRRVHLVEHADVYGAARQVPAARPRRRLLHADDRPAQLDARRQARLVGAPPRAPPAAAVRAAAARRHIVVLVRRAHAVPARAARTRLLRPLQAAAADGRLAAQDADAGRLRERVGPRLLREVAPRTHAVRRRRGAAAAAAALDAVGAALPAAAVRGHQLRRGEVAQLRGGAHVLQVVDVVHGALALEEALHRGGRGHGPLGHGVLPGRAQAALYPRLRTWALLRDRRAVDALATRRRHAGRGGCPRQFPHTTHLCWIFVPALWLNEVQIL